MDATLILIKEGFHGVVFSLKEELLLLLLLLLLLTSRRVEGRRSESVHGDRGGDVSIEWPGKMDRVINGWKRGYYTVGKIISFQLRAD